MTLHLFIFLLIVTLLRVFLIIIFGAIVGHSCLGVEDKTWLRFSASLPLAWKVSMSIVGGSRS